MQQISSPELLRPQGLAVHGGVPFPTPEQHPHRPSPNLQSGELVIDPEIALRAKGMDVLVSTYYLSGSAGLTEYGVGRSATTRSSLKAVDSHIELTRGDQSVQYYNQVGTASGITTYASSNNTGNVTTLSYDTGADQYTEYYGDGFKLIYKEKVSGTYFLTRVEDPSANAHSYTYGTGDEAGLLKSIQVAGGQLVTWIYEDKGLDTLLVSAIEDWDLRRWTMQYDAQGYLTTYMTPLGCITKFGYAEAGAGAGNTMVHTIEDPRGFVTTYMYDGQRRVVSLAAGSAVWTYTFNDNKTILTSPSNALTTYNYLGQLLESVQGPHTGLVTTYSYNSNLLTTKQQIPAGYVMSVAYTTTTSGLWLITASDDALGKRTTMQYDSSGNMTTLIDAMGAVSTFGYATPSNHLRTRATDPLGRVTSYGYDASGQMVSVTDARGLVTTMNYDTKGNIASMQHSDTGVVTYNHDRSARSQNELRL
jgi:YD repeat-containing protein